MYTRIGFTGGVDSLGPTNLSHIEEGIENASKRYSGIQTVTNYGLTANGSRNVVTFAAAEYRGDATDANFEYLSTGIKGFLIPAGVSSANVAFSVVINSVFTGTAEIEIRRYRGGSFIIVGTQAITPIGGEVIGSCSANPPVAEGDTLQAFIYVSTATNATLKGGTSFSCTAN